MSVSKYNSEGYYDPTAYGALQTIEQEQRSFVLSGLSFISVLPMQETSKRTWPLPDDIAAML